RRKPNKKRQRTTQELLKKRLSGPPKSRKKKRRPLSLQLRQQKKPPSVKSLRLSIAQKKKKKMHARPQQQHWQKLSKISLMQLSQSAIAWRQKSKRPNASSANSKRTGHTLAKSVKRQKKH